MYWIEWIFWIIRLKLLTFILNINVVQNWCKPWETEWIICIWKMKINFSNITEHDYYNAFDFICDSYTKTTSIELKIRRCNFETYPNTKINLSKINKRKKSVKCKTKKLKITSFFILKW